MAKKILRISLGIIAVILSALVGKYLSIYSALFMNVSTLFTLDLNTIMKGFREVFNSEFVGTVAGLVAGAPIYLAIFRKKELKRFISSIGVGLIRGFFSGALFTTAILFYFGTSINTSLTTSMALLGIMFIFPVWLLFGLATFILYWFVRNDEAYDP